MRIAIPVLDGVLSGHFGHPQFFAFLELDEQGSVTGREDIVPPPHQPGVLPGWVAQQGANVVLVGGIGARAVQLFEQHGVAVVTGCPTQTPEELAKTYHAGTLKGGQNTCDH